MSNYKFQMSIQDQMSNDKKKFDLQERTAKFGEDIIDFVKRLPNDLVNRRLLDQIIRSGTSVGANYMEADGAESKKDFRHKIGICKKESKESMHWLRMVARANPSYGDDCRRLWQETKELTLIFSSILRSNKTDI